MRARLWLSYCFIVLSLSVHGQLFLEIPEDIRYNMEKALPFAEDQLTEGVNAVDSANWKIVLAGLYCRTGRFAIADSILLTITDRDQLPKPTQCRYWLANGISLKFGANQEMANEAFEKSIQIAQGISDENYEIEALIEKAEFNRKIANFYIARQTIKKALSKLEKPTKGQYNLMAYALGRYAAILNEGNELRNSIKISKQSLEYALKTGNKFLQGTSYNELGFTYKQFVNVDTTLMYYDKAFEAFQSSGMLLDAAHVKFNRIQFCSHNDLYLDQLMGWWEGLIDYVQSNNIDYPIHNVWFSLSGQYKKYGMWEKAYHAYNNFHNEYYNDSEQKRQKEIDRLAQEERNQKIKDDQQEILKELRTEQAVVNQQQRKIVIAMLFLGVAVFLMIFIIRLFLKSRRLAQKLEVKNREKDLLIQEVHHRVKNNLNFIQSLLEMQESSSHSTEEAVGLQKASIRISSVSELHKMLYTDNESGLIDVADYTKALIDSLKSTFENPDRHIEVKCEIEPLEMNIQDCTAYGQLVTECFTNSVKHAFPQVDVPVFSISLSREGAKQAVLNISDNGKGKATPNADETGSSMGMRLIAIFSRQLRGKYSLAFNPGFSYTLKFNLYED